MWTEGEIFDFQKCSTGLKESQPRGYVERYLDLVLLLWHIQENIPYG